MALYDHEKVVVLEDRFKRFWQQVFQEPLAAKKLTVAKHSELVVVALELQNMTPLRKIVFKLGRAVPVAVLDFEIAKIMLRLNN